MADSKQKIALVTGASSGMGKDFAKALLKEGMIVYAVARRLEKMDDIKALGALPLKMDITKEEDIQQVVSTIEKNHGGVDILINNAGFGLFGSVEETTMEDARYQFDVNIFGLARLTQLIIPHMRSQRAGKIINITSIGGKIYSPLGSWYHATKFALEGWSDCLRLELKQFDVDVVVIEPGAIATEFGDVLSDPMLARSTEGPYSTLANNLKKAFDRQEQQGDASPASVITSLVLKAIKSPKPKTRYAGGKYARTLLFIKHWFSDRFFDNMIMGMIK